MQKTLRAPGVLWYCLVFFCVSVMLLNVATAGHGVNLLFVTLHAPLNKEWEPH
jgi:hypothetical protein